MIKQSKILINFITVLWIILLFSGTRMVTRYYTTALVFILIFYYGVLFVRGDRKTTRKRFMLLPLNVYVIISSIWSFSSEATAVYVPFFLLALIVICGATELGNKNIFYGLVELISLLVAISIIIETINISFVYNFFWFLFEKNKGMASYLIEMKAGEKYIGAFSGIIGEKSDAAFLLVIGLILTWVNVLIKDNLSQNSKWRFYLECSLMYIALFLTGKRTLFFCSFLIILIVLYVSQKKCPQRANNKIILIIFFLGLVFFVAQFFQGTSVMFERLTMSHESDVALQEREKVWKVCLDMFVKHPLTGTGFASFVEYCGTYFFNTASFAHNIYLEWIGELGILGILVAGLSIITIGEVIKNTFRKLQEFPNEVMTDFAFSLSVVAVIAVYGFTGNCMYYPFEYLWLLWGVANILTISEGCYRKVQEQNYKYHFI